MTLAMSYNAGSQALTRTMSNSAYAYAPTGVAADYTANGLDQYASVSGTSFSYDARGNLSSDGARAYGYDAFNRLTSVSGSPSLALAYDPAGRLYESSASGTATRFLYDGATLIGETDASGTLLRRFVPGPGVDEPLVWYEGAGTSDRRWLLQDRMGSTIGAADAAGASLATYAYDEYGRPGAWTGPRLRYTGAMMLPEAQLYHLRARAYSPALGRFMQSDPILYGGGMNVYAYVGNDPVNWRDPTGLRTWVCEVKHLPENEEVGTCHWDYSDAIDWFFRDWGIGREDWQLQMREANDTPLAALAEIMDPGQSIPQCQRQHLAEEYGQDVVNGARVHNGVPLGVGNAFALPSALRPGGSNIYMNATSPSMQFNLNSHELDHARTYGNGTQTPESIIVEYFQYGGHDAAPAEQAADAARNRVLTSQGNNPCP